MGDKDVLALELATRNYRKEIDESGRAKNNSYSYSYIEFSGALNMYNYSGTQSAALGLITGKKVNVIRSGIDDNTIIKDGMLYMQRLDENYLKPIFDNKDNIVLVSLKNGSSDGHAYTFKSYDDEYIYLVNPYDTSKIEKMDKEEFYKNIIDVSYTNLKTDVTESENEYKAYLLKYPNKAANEPTLNYLRQKYPNNDWN